MLGFFKIEWIQIDEFLRKARKVMNKIRQSLKLEEKSEDHNDEEE